MKISQYKIAIIGTGNIGGAIAHGIINSGIIEPYNLTLTKRKTGTITRFYDLGVKVTSRNPEAVRNSDIIIIAVTPQQLDDVLGEIKSEIGEGKIIISVVSGAGIDDIKEKLGRNIKVIRAMPNTAISLQESMTCISGRKDEQDAIDLTVEIFNSVGRTYVIEEKLMIPATALVACGIAFFLRAIRAASQGGIEIGFHSEEALLMAAQTAKGAATLLLSKGNHPEHEVDKVTTPQGCTISGLNQMEHNGFSSALIKGIITSAEKAERLYSPK